MTLYAHVAANAVDAVGQPPLLYDDGARWWDLRDRDPAILATLGWLPVTQTPRPADTDTTTHDYSVTLVGGVPTETWTERPKTQAELDAATAATNEAALISAARGAIAGNKTFLALASPTNAQTLAQVKALTRQMNALIRLQVRDLLDTTGT